VAAGISATEAVSNTRMDGVAWTGIRDSDGVALADYLFVTDYGGLSNPGATAFWMILGLEFVGYLVLVNLAIWFIGYVLGFQWLDSGVAVLSGAADALAAQLGGPVVSATAATVGAFFIAWFVIRGAPGKAVRQTVTLSAVAVLGAVFVSTPVAGVLSSDGVLARGRDLGLSVAAGLHRVDTDPEFVIGGLTTTLSDSFARRPVQVWNFGHVLDRGCSAMWSVHVTAGDTEALRQGLADCGDAAAAARAAQPTAGQLASGLVLLLCAAVLLVFAVFLAGLIMKSALDTIYHAFLAVPGLAAGGFSYGPTQNFLIRNLVQIGFAAARMCAYTLFLGVYLLFLGGLLEQAQGQVIAVLVLAAVLELIAVGQLARLRASLSRGSGWVTARLVEAVQGPAAADAGRGTGTSSAGGSAPGVLTDLRALEIVDNSPITAWLAGATVRPLSPLAYATKKSQRAVAAASESFVETHRLGQFARNNWLMLILREADKWGGIDNEMGVSRALKQMRDNRIPDSSLAPALRAAGASDRLVSGGILALSVQEATRSRWPLGFLPLQKAVAAAHAAVNYADTDTARSFAAQAVVAADGFVRQGKPLVRGVAVDQAFIRRVERYQGDGPALVSAITPDEWNTVGLATRRTIADRTARDHLAATRAFHKDPSETNRVRLLRSAARVANLDRVRHSAGLGPWDG
jgi:hypothetical protein